jgi:hypothetical protein
LGGDEISSIDEISAVSAGGRARVGRCGVFRSFEENVAGRIPFKG